MHIPKLDDEFMEQVQQVQKSYRENKIKTYLQKNAMSLCSLVISLASLIVAIIALFV